MKKTFGESTFDILNIIALSILGIITFYPFYYIFIYSISNPDLAAGGLTIYPKGITILNYLTIFKIQGIFHAAFISAARTVTGTVLTLTGCSLVAYGLSKNKLPLRKFMYRALLLTMYINSGLIPWYLTMKAMGLRNNFLLYILPGTVVAFYVVLLKTYFEQLPPSIEESAMVDGANHFTVWRKLIMPMSRPILATVAIFQAVGQWNGWTDNLYLCNNPKLQTLQLMLLNFLQSSSANAFEGRIVDTTQITQITPTSVRMTITIVVVLPVFLVYPLLQRHFIKGILLGAVKG
ncbi:MAG: carbohydrate ABC transporter permease [Clostridiaceae bacterium]